MALEELRLHCTEAARMDGNVIPCELYLAEIEDACLRRIRGTGALLVAAGWVTSISGLVGVYSPLWELTCRLIRQKLAISSAQRSSQ